MNRLFIYTLLLPLWVSFFSRYSAQTPPPQAVVHAVLFYSPACGHCQMVINNTLLPLFEQYGDQLSMIGIDVTQSSGQTLFSAALQYFGLESSGVPFLVIGDTYLVGSINIPQQFPGMIEEYLAQGGIDWPAIPGLSETLAASQSAEATQAAGSTPTAASAPAPTATPGILITEEEHGGLGARFANDPVGNSLAVIILAGMLVSVAGALLTWQAKPAAQKGNPAPANTWRWLIPLLCLVGIGVAGYLSYVETAQVEAVCGPVGDCNTVQQSEYARLFGVLPIGILGIIGYILILFAWVGARFGQGRLATYAHLAMLGLTAFGVLFSIYLTVLEPFIIGATCAWCLTSAIITTALLWLSLVPARTAYRSLHQRTFKALVKS
jgi:uncharacterized membrane protein/thiol-disulfide isomerase/thioredoxin